MNLTLWTLNRVTEWESDPRFRGQLRDALANGSDGTPMHDVRLGRRLVRKPEAPDPSVVELAVNQTQDSFRGELMHEGYQQKLDNTASAYDEYFMPIPLKCLGKPDYNGAKAALPPFWQDMILPDRQDEFLQILQYGDDQNPCFDPKIVDIYWQEGRRPFGEQSELAREFGQVRMNTAVETRIGYYHILQQAKKAHGKNVLVGYSQGGTVVNYLAYIDEHFVIPEKRCIAGIISVQGALCGSPLAMPSCEDNVLGSIQDMGRALWGPHVAKLLAVPDRIRDLIDPLIGRKEPLKINEVTTVLDELYVLAKGDKGLREVISSARKWLSGLHRDNQLAFFDIDCARMNIPGTVLNAIASNPLKATCCGAVVGLNFRLEPLFRALLDDIYSAHAETLKTLEFIFGALVSHIVQGAQNILENRTFDMIPTPLTEPDAPLTRLHTEWESDLQEGWDVLDKGSVPAKANDCVIPSASQTMRPSPEAGARFLGNFVNPDASHVSGALLDDKGPEDIDYVKRLLQAMAECEGLGEL